MLIVSYMMSICRPIGLYRDVWIAAIASRDPFGGNVYYRDVWIAAIASRDPFGGNVYYVTMQITFLTRKIRNGERYLHCDVVHITAVPPNGSLASLSIAMAFSR